IHPRSCRKLEARVASARYAVDIGERRAAGVNLNTGKVRAGIHRNRARGRSRARIRIVAPVEPAAVAVDRPRVRNPPIGVKLYAIDLRSRGVRQDGPRTLTGHNKAEHLLVLVLVVEVVDVHPQPVVEEIALQTELIVSYEFRLDRWGKGRELLH